jgi:hypothetical protein
MLYARYGAVIKEIATGKVAGHIQELSGWKLLQHLPIPGGNPLGLVTEAIQVAQLHRIQQTLSTVQTLATVGAVTSVATLGVSIAGFAVVLSKLNRMERKLDHLLAGTAQVRSLAERLHVKIDALSMAALQARLEAVSMAWFYDEPRRRHSLQDSVERLAELRHYYGALLANHEFCTFSTNNLVALLDTQERLVAACQGELFAEFLLGSEPRVISERWRYQREVFDGIAWRTAETLYQLAEQGDRDAGVFMVTDAQERRAKVKAITNIRTESTARLASVPALVEFLHDRDVTVTEYIGLLEEQQRAGENLIVIDAREFQT